MILKKNGVAYNLSDKTQIDAFIASGWIPGEESSTPDFANMNDEQLAAYAEKVGVDVSRLRSRESVIARLEKEAN